MKTTLYSLLAAAACGMALGQTAYTTPVGYYNFDAKAGSNLFIPGFVNSAAYSGVLVGASSTTLTVAANSLTAGAFNEGAVYATHYAEITSGPNAGVVLDIVSNTTSVITLADDISALSLAGTESIKVRPHVTLGSSLADAEPLLNVISDVATFYNSDGSDTTYFYGADPSGSGWSSDFTNNDGDLRPIPPGSGVVLSVVGDALLQIVGEVKDTPSGVTVFAGVVNIVGPMTPLVGTSTSLNDTGFGSLAAFSDTITIYEAGPLVNNVAYVPLGDGTLSSDYTNPTTDVIANTTGAVVIPSVDATLILNDNITVAP